MTVFILRTHYPSGRTWENICSSSGYASQCKYKDGYKTPFEIRLLNDALRKVRSSSGSIMRLMPVFILETHNQTNYKMFAQVLP